MSSIHTLSVIYNNYITDIVRWYKAMDTHFDQQCDVMKKLRSHFSRLNNQLKNEWVSFLSFFYFFFLFFFVMQTIFSTTDGLNYCVIDIE